jgi:hypothetical protein
MKLKFSIAAIAVIATPTLIFAQDQVDALRYSQVIVGGTARFMAMGGAFSAVGGDPSTLAYNPAGIGVFVKSQFTITPGFSFVNTTSTYNGTASSSGKAAMNIQNAAWIASWKNRHNDGMWKNLSFGIAYNRTNNFNTDINIQGYNTQNTLLDEFVNEANGTSYNNLDPFSTQQAFNAGGLIDTIKGEKGSSYFNIINPFLGKGSIMQQKAISTWGSMGETDISFGGNYNNKLYLGATIGIPDIMFNENAAYTETPQYNDSVYGLQSYTWNTTLNTTGAGLNFKFGAIYRILDWLRVGAAVHSPTWFSLTDNYSSYISATYNSTPAYPNGAGTFSGTPDGNPITGSYNYTLITPMRAMGGLAVVIHHQAIISADYEYVDYSTAQFQSTPPGAFSAVNQTIQQFYMPASNIRVGGELVLFPFSIRAGYVYYGNPYTSDAGNSTIRSSYSAGFGIKIRRCFIDLAYVLTQYSENYYIYGSNMAVNKVSASNVAFTFGAKL